MKRWQKYLYNHPILGWTIIVVIIAASVPGILNLRVDNSLNSWFLEDDPAYLAYEQFTDQFGNDEVIFLLLEDEQFSSDNPAYISELYRDLNGLPFVRGMMTSLADAIPTLAVSSDQLPLRHLVEQRKVDQHVAWLVLEEMMYPEADRSILLDAIDRMEADFPKLKIYKAGYGVVYDEINRISVEESSLFIVLSYLLIMFVAFLFLRRFRAILAGGLGVLLSLILTLGIMGYAGWNINMVSMALPSLVFAISIADVMHVFRGMNATLNNEETNTEEVYLTALHKATKPCFYTSLTTIFGFLSLTVAKIRIIREFGFAASLAVFIAFVIILLLVIPTMLRFVQTTAKPQRQSLKIWQSLYSFITRRKSLIIALGSILFLALIPGVLKLTVDTNSIGFLLPDNQVRQDSEKIEEDYGNYLPLDFMYYTDFDQTQNTEWIQEVQQFEAAVVEKTSLEKGISVSDIASLDEMGKKVIDEAIPLTADDGRTGRSMFLAPMVSANELKTIEKEVLSLASVHLNHVEDARFAGYMPLYSVMMEYILDEQIQSFSIAFVVISLLLLLLYRNPRHLLWSLIPNILPVLGTLGLMGWLGIPLDIATVTIAAIAIGIVVDDTVHFLHHYFNFHGKSDTAGDAILRTLEFTGGAILATSLILIAGLSVLLLTSIYSMIFFGLLLMVCITLALLCDLLYLPALLMGRQR